MEKVAIMTTDDTVRKNRPIFEGMILKSFSLLVRNKAKKMEERKAKMSPSKMF
jgi:hypothetical protein